jgi:hypothetical protein
LRAEAQNRRDRPNSIRPAFSQDDQSARIEPPIATTKKSDQRQTAEEATQVPFEVMKSKQHFSLTLHFQLTFLLSIPLAVQLLLFSLAALAFMPPIGRAVATTTPTNIAKNKRILNPHW